MSNVFIENATLQNIADAIRGKTGKTETMLPAEMPAEIESIESGVDLSKLCCAIRFNNLNIFGKSEVVLDLDNVITLNAFYTISNNGGIKNETVEKLTLNCNKPITDMYKAFIGEVGTSDKKLKTLVLNIDTSQNENLTNGFLGMEALETIDGTPLDFSSCTGLNQPFRNCAALVNVKVVENTIKISFSINYSKNLSVESAKSIILGLANYAGTDKELTYTVSFSSETKAALEAEGNTAPDGNTWVLYACNKGWNT